MEAELERRWHVHVYGGTRVEVGDDEDGLSLCKIACYEDKELIGSFYLADEAVRLLSVALAEYADNKECGE